MWKRLRFLPRWRKSAAIASIRRGRPKGKTWRSKEEGELNVLETYLPKPLTEAEIEVLVDEAISETGAKGPKDIIGMVIKAIKPKWAGRADGKQVSEIVKKKLVTNN